LSSGGFMSFPPAIWRLAPPGRWRVFEQPKGKRDSIHSLDALCSVLTQGKSNLT
jgi:hypothetical protein